MSTRDDGGPAFPHDGQANYTGGMTLRDYFAAAALQGFLSAQTRPYDAAQTARDAYIYADLMLAERAK